MPPRKIRRLVFTNGCFDILHVGHVRYLEAARRLGDSLIVGLNNDASVRRLKGPGRPLNKAKDRAEVLSGLSCVDKVVIFGEDTPLRLIKKLKPQVLVKGGDWPLDKIVGADFVRERGGKVFSIKFIRGFSTTSLIHRVKSSRA